MTFEENVRKVICDILAVEEAPDAASITEDLGADSLDAVELVMALEEEFDIEIGDEEAESLETVSDVMAHVRAKFQG